MTGGVSVSEGSLPVRASRLMEMLVWLQLQGGAPATEPAAAFEVSVRTVYRDVEALCAAGVPIHTVVGRNGGIRIDPSYRLAGLSRLDATEAPGVLFAVVPAIADPLVRCARRHAGAGRSCHGCVGVLRSQLVYRGTDVVVQPLGLILKGDKWYLLGLARGGAERQARLFRLSRVDAVEVLDHRFDRPPGFDLAAAWAARRRAFLDSIPEYFVTVLVAPAAEPLLALLEGTGPPLPLPADIERDEHGWARLRLRFDRRDSAARHLLRFGADIEALDPPELRECMAVAAVRLAALYSAHA